MTSIILSPDTAPVTPEEGEIYYDSGTNKIKVRDASSFKNVVSENSSGEIDGTFSGTIGSSASFPATHHSGHVVQVVEMHDNTRTSIYNTYSKIYDAQITTKLASSKIYVSLNTCRGTSNVASPCALAMGYKTGAVSASENDYASIHSSLYTEELVPNLGSFWTQSTQDPNSHNSGLGRYGMVPVLFNTLHTPNVAAGTTLSYSLWGSSSTSNRFLGIGGASNAGASNAMTGYDSNITLMEISP